MTELRFCHADKLNRVLIAVYIDSIMGVYKNSPHIHYCVYYAEAVHFGFVLGRRIGWQTAGIKNIPLPSVAFPSHQNKNSRQLNDGNQ